jgi:hypothetical protein
MALSVPHKVLVELHVSTASYHCDYHGNGSFTYTLSQNLNFYLKKGTQMAVKDFQFPIEPKTIEFQIYFGGLHDTVSATNLKTFTVKYNSMTDLAKNLLKICNNHFEKNIKLLENMKQLGSLTICDDYRTPHHAHKCSYSLDNIPFTLIISYENGSFTIIVHPELKLVMSANLARLLGMKTVILDQYTQTEKIGKTELELVGECCKLITFSQSTVFFRFISDESCNFFFS